MTLTLYSISGAPRPWRVLLGLALKSLPWQQQLLSGEAGEHRAEPFLSINPRATVPVLQHGDIVIRDSIAALAWLDRAFPEQPLFGDTPDEAARIWQTTLEACDYLRQANKSVLNPVLQQRQTPQPGTAEAETLTLAAEKLHAECRWLEALLQDQPYLVGTRPSAADAVVFPEIRLIQRAVETCHDVMDQLGFGFPPDLYPHLSAWKDRFSALPGVADTMPPHWQEDQTQPKTQNYKKTITVPADTDAAYAALTTGFDQWWTLPDKPIRAVGDQARFSFPPGHSSWTFVARKLLPGAYVELECVDADHRHDGLPPEIEKEWLGSRLIWNIAPAAQGTEIRFEHVGLAPRLHCYDVCEQGWDHFFGSSLAALLATGQGTPHRAAS
jgi:glutathione S-transferase